jgi:GDP-4-dehydro-6-deoxy-D-mannose reductase
MRAFVTGGTGFAGTWLCDHLREQGDEVTVFTGSITDPDAITIALGDVVPDAVYHLAGQANVGKSWDEPADTFRVNAEGTLHLVQAVVDQWRRIGITANPTSRVVIVSSAEVYGVIPPEAVPVKESQAIAPVSPYAASKVAAEQVALQAFRAHGLPVVVARPFNHIGPGQAPSFVVSALAHRIAEAIASGTRTVTMGNPDPRRDFTDVRDIVAAYRLLAVGGIAGETYNVATGNSVSIGTLAQRMIDLSDAELVLEIEDVHRRAVDIPDLCGSTDAIRLATGWKPQISLDQTLTDVLENVRKAQQSTAD